MNDDPEHVRDEVEDRWSLLALAALAPIVGAIAGFVGAIFRLTLEKADIFRDTFIAWAHEYGLMGFVLVAVVCASATFLASWLVRRFSPYASGSGIPHVEAVLNEELTPAPFSLIPIKFVGGILAIGSGLALGREGPSVQMGASIGHLVGVMFRRAWPDCRVLLAAGAGAGLATAFNAPIAGAVFVLEELVRRFEPRIAAAALGASATAIAVARTLLGEAPDFHVGALSYANFDVRPLFFLLGAFSGLLAVVYNISLLKTLEIFDGLDRWPPGSRAIVVGAAVGILAWFAPQLVGGGNLITQNALNGVQSVAFIPLVFIVRLMLGATSYAVGAPGGLFAPLLALGAQSGLLFGVVCRHAFPGLDIQPEAFALVGMSALFTGVVRAPVTGLVLVTEMTGNVTMLLPMLGACFVAMVTQTLMRNPPIYESLLAHMMKRDDALKPGPPSRTHKS
jgi:chloride channel protein, CIC family